MFYVQKKIELSSAHYLKLNYKSKCSNLHGHNWIVTVYCKSAELDENGMVVDFTHIKDAIAELDHTNLNDLLAYNPTAENIAKDIQSLVTNCYKVTVQESEGNIATYEVTQ